MKICARVRNGSSEHKVTVATAGVGKELVIPMKAVGAGSSVNGGEFLMLALATCYCNDVYREAARLGVPVDAVEVEASAEFSGVGLAATDVSYRARVSSPASADVIAALLRHTDTVAEVQNTIRREVPVAFLGDLNP